MITTTKTIIYVSEEEEEEEQEEEQEKRCPFITNHQNLDIRKHHRQQRRRQRFSLLLFYLIWPCYFGLWTDHLFIVQSFMIHTITITKGSTKSTPSTTTIHNNNNKLIINMNDDVTTTTTTKSPWNTTVFRNMKVWGKQPLLLRGAFHDDIIISSSTTSLPTWDEIIDLACLSSSDVNDDDDDDYDDVVPSRLIAHYPNNMESFELIGFGPFESNESLNQQLLSPSVTTKTTSSFKASTLIVNDVDRYIPELSDWMDNQFGTLIPRWRRDDAQISLANTLGGIGPHVDNYDVFLIQLSGNRTWEIGVDFYISIQDEYDNLIDTASQRGVRILNVTNILQQQQQQQYNGTTIKIHVEPGDCLYLPPRVMHCGTATSDNCMTLSVGCRAPSAADLITRLSETILLEPRSILETLQQRYAESDLDEYLFKDSSPGATSIGGIPTISSFLSHDIKTKMKSLILKAIEDALDDEENIFDPLVGKIVTEPNRASSFSYPTSLDDMDDDWKNELGVWGNATTAIEEALVKGNGCLRRVEGIAFAWSLVHGDKQNHPKFRMYANGREAIEFFVEDEKRIDTIGQMMNRIASGPPLDKQFIEDRAMYLQMKADDNIYNFLLELVEKGLLYGDES